MKSRAFPRASATIPRVSAGTQAAATSKIMFSSRSADTRSELATRATLVFLLLIALSFIPGFFRDSDLLRDLSRELGIVLFAVFTVSLLYEWPLAEVHLEKFRRLLAEEIQRGESNAAVCAKLGIERIFTTRDSFERDYPITSVMGELKSGDNVRIVATSLFHIMNKAETLRKALARGVSVELCLLNPSFSDVGKVPGLVSADIVSAIVAFKRDIRDWVVREKPAGRIGVRCHETPLSASFSRFRSKAHDLGIWDLSFGRDLADKRVFVLDASTGIGLDLRNRFDAIFDEAVKVFTYHDRKPELDRVDELLAAV